MNVSIRAKRILSGIPAYEVRGTIKDWPEEIAYFAGGEPIGCYKNIDPRNEVIWIFEMGIGWNHQGANIFVPYEQIAEAALPDGKESEWILLRTKDGKQFQLPVYGRRGRFNDSMEILRFLDRVTIGDGVSHP